jgi:hypothetical protein
MVCSLVWSYYWKLQFFWDCFVDCWFCSNRNWVIVVLFLFRFSVIVIVVTLIKLWVQKATRRSQTSYKYLLMGELIRISCYFN